jgi:hypothetical protein
MFWVAVGLVIFGAVCGAAFRALFLIAILLAATAIVVGSDIARGSPEVFIDAAITIVTLQVGYVLGIAARALVYARARRQREPAKRDPARYPTVSSRQDRH